MPTVKKHRYMRDYAGTLSEAQLDYLVSGECLDGDELSGIEDNYMPFASMEAAGRAYKKHRKEILLAARGRMDKRWVNVDGEFRLVYIPAPLPFAFWKWDASEVKLQLAGPAPLPGGFWFGIPVKWNSYEESKAAVFETDTEYIQRLKLSL